MALTDVAPRLAPRLAASVEEGDAPRRLTRRHRAGFTRGRLSSCPAAATLGRR